MKKQIIFWNPKTEQVSKVNSSLGLYWLIRGFALWPLLAFLHKRFLLGAAGLIVFVAFFGFGLGEKWNTGIETCFLFVYLAIGLFYVVNYKNLLISSYLKRGWLVVQAREDGSIIFPSRSNAAPVGATGEAYRAPKPERPVGAKYHPTTGKNNGLLWLGAGILAFTAVGVAIILIAQNPDTPVTHETERKVDVPEEAQESERIKQLLDSQNYKGAIQEATSGKKLYVADFLKISTALNEKKLRGEALKLLLYAEGKFPDDADIENELGLIYSASGDNANAIMSFLHAEKVDPKAATIESNLGYAYYNSGDYASAAAKFHEALALEPDNKTAQEGLTLAEAAENNKRLEHADQTANDSPAASAQGATQTAVDGEHKDEASPKQ